MVPVAGLVIQNVGTGGEPVDVAADLEAGAVGEREPGEVRGIRPARGGDNGGNGGRGGPCAVAADP